MSVMLQDILVDTLHRCSSTTNSFIIHSFMDLIFDQLGLCSDVVCNIQSLYVIVLQMGVRLTIKI